MSIYPNVRAARPAKPGARQRHVHVGSASKFRGERMTARTCALAYISRDRLYYYIPTQPEARKWRGPYPNQDKMERAVCSELGRDVHITWAAVEPVWGSEDRSRQLT